MNNEITSVDILSWLSHSLCDNFSTFHCIVIVEQLQTNQGVESDCENLK